MTLLCLHGFLGTAKDWSRLPFNRHILGIDLFNHEQPLPSMWEWADEVYETSLKGNEPIGILGYSLGGRLAMHLLVRYPHAFNYGIIVSAHPGLQDEEAKLERRRSDKGWANAFRSENWEQLIKKWNEQTVFLSDNTEMDRHEQDYNRKRLAEALTSWSLSFQDNLKPQVEAVNLPILWVAGEKDRKYAGIAREMSLKHPKSSVWIAEGAGHRVPWEKPEAFIKQIDRFTHFISIKKSVTHEQ